MEGGGDKGHKELWLLCLVLLLNSARQAIRREIWENKDR